MMMVALIQLALIGVWGSMVVIQTRRLFRLAHVELRLRNNSVRLRDNLNRVWWWLGQESFWLQVQRDTAYSIVLTCMLIALTWGMS